MLEDINQAYKSAFAIKKEWSKVNAITFIEKHEEEITEIIIDELRENKIKSGFRNWISKEYDKRGCDFSIKNGGGSNPIY